jgi:integrase
MLKLFPPRKGYSSHWRIRGTYLGQHVNRSAKTGDRKIAAKLLKKWREDIERGAYTRPDDPTFASAALSYMQAGGERRFLKPLLEYFGERLLAQIGQREVDGAGAALFPEATAATRNRQVYGPVSAVLRHVGITTGLRRPKGSRGESRLSWLSQDEAFVLLAAATELHGRFGALCTFLLYTGCRLSEGLRLQSSDIMLAP